MKEWVLGKVRAYKLKEHLPETIYPVSLKIELSLSPDVEVFTYRENEEPKKFSDKYYDERTFAIYRVKNGVLIKPTRLNFKNPLFYEGMVDYDKFVKDVKDAHKYIEESEQPQASRRIYLSNFKFCKIPEEYAEGESRWDNDLYESDQRCYIVEFGKASTEDKKIQITKKAKMEDGAISESAPGRTTIPCVLSSIKAVIPKQVRNLDKKAKSRLFWTEKKLEKKEISPREWQGKRPKEWNRDDGSKLNSRFEEFVIEETSKDIPLFSKHDLSGKTHRRDIFRAKKVEETE